MLAKSKPALTLTQRIRSAADKVRAVDEEIKDVIEAWLDEQKMSQAGQGLAARDLPSDAYREIRAAMVCHSWPGKGTRS